MARRVCRVRVLYPMLVLAGMAVGGVLAGCGPIVYVSEVTRHASDAVDSARAAHADRYAPYWWTRATQYLEKAREIAAYADFQGANRFGRLAAEAANKATEEAQIAEQAPPPPPRPPEVRPDVRPDVAPAKDPAGARTAPAKDPAGPRVAPVKDAP